MASSSSLRCLRQLSHHLRPAPTLAPPAAQPAAAAGGPVSILSAEIGGHVHPSICRTADGTLVVVYVSTTTPHTHTTGATTSSPHPTPPHHHSAAR